MRKYNVKTSLLPKRRTVLSVLLIVEMLLFLICGGVCNTAASTISVGAGQRVLKIEYSGPSSVSVTVSKAADMGKTFTLHAYCTDETEKDTEFFEGLKFVKWGFNWDAKYTGKLTDENLTVTIPNKTAVSKDLVVTRYFELDPSYDISKISNPLSHLTKISFSPSTIQKGETTTITLTFDKSYTNGKIRIGLYNNVKDGKMASQTKHYSKNIEGNTVRFEDKGSDLYGGTAYVCEVQLFKKDTTDYSTKPIASLPGNNPVLNSIKLTITGGDPVYTPVNDKGVIDQGTTVKGDPPKTGAKGSSASATEKLILNSKKEEIATAEFAPLKAYSKKTTKKSVTVKWSKVDKATSYVIYGNKCGKKRRTEPMRISSAARSTCA